MEARKRWMILRQVRRRALCKMHIYVCVQIESHEGMNLKAESIRVWDGRCLSCNPCSQKPVNEYERYTWCIIRLQCRQPTV